METINQALPVLTFLAGHPAVLTAVVLLLSLALLLIGVLLVALRKQLLPLLSFLLPGFFKDRFKTLTPCADNPQTGIWKRYDVERKTSYIFHSNLIVQDAEEFRQDIEAIVDHHRTRHEPLTISFVGLGVANAAMTKGFKGAIEATIKANNVQLLVVFPCSDKPGLLMDLRQWMEERIAQTGTTSVKVRVDMPNTQTRIFRRLERE